MNKIGEMTSEEFKEALKEIMKSDKKEEKKESENELEKTLKEACDFLETVKEWLTLAPLRKMMAEPLTKEVFIRRGKKIKDCLWELVSTVVFVIVAIIVIRYCIFEIRWIPSASMKPTLIEGDRVVVDRFSRFKTLPQRGDVMIFYPPSETLENTPIKVFKRLTGFFCKDIAYIKRVIGVPGDKFEIKRDEIGRTTVYIDDIPLDESYIKDSLDYPVCTEDMVCGPMIIPEGQYFMMGDNRGNSKDSRYWGLLPQNRFIGKAIFVTRFAKLQ